MSKTILGISGEIVIFSGEILAAKTCTSAAKSLFKLFEIRLGFDNFSRNLFSVCRKIVK